VGQSYKELIVWRRAFELCVAIYKYTQGFPAAEQFGLTNQLRRASVSVASNIAEGYGKSTKGEYLQFLGHARGSIFEVETQLAIAEALKYGSASNCAGALALAKEVSKMLVSLMTKLKNLK
jgi:four helix bundle protein